MSSAPRPTLDADFLQQFLGRVKSRKEPEAQAPRLKSQTAYRQAAAVLSNFELDALNAYPRVEKSAATVVEFLSDTMPVARPKDGQDRTLRATARRQTLRLLKTRKKMREARAANPDIPQSPLQTMIDLVISDDVISFADLDHEHLVALSTVINWFAGILDGLPDRSLLRRHVALAAVRAPLEVLAGQNGRDFVGRAYELQQLRDYVGVLPATGNFGSVWRFVSELRYDLLDRPPLFIHGPGGVGKSTLVAKFILEHTDRREGNPVLPSIYLNFDRPSLSPRRLSTLLFEAANQLAQQFQEVEDQVRKYVEQLQSDVQGTDALEYIKSTSNTDYQIAGFAKICEALPVDDAPILFVLDTFEEVQFLGEHAVILIWEFMEELQRAQPRLRFVVSGRAHVGQRFVSKEVPLNDLDHDSAKSYLAKQFMKIGAAAPDMQVLSEVVDAIGTNPLSLRLTAWLVAREGLEALSTIQSRRFFLIRVKAERIQAQLYDRILSHIHKSNTSHGQQLRQIASPGLVVRRITKDVITEVLAGPCDLLLADDDDATTLLRLLEREATLVERDPEDPEHAVRHLAELRRLMLPSLVSAEPDKTREIDEAAVRYYQQFEQPVMRAEEIYHRLRLKQGADEVDPRWMSGVERTLGSALEEVAPEQKLYLTQKLGNTPDSELLEQADQASWEKSTETLAQAYMGESAFEHALKAIRARGPDNRMPGSPLYYLEASALHAVGRTDEAIEVAQNGVHSMAAAASTGPAEASLLWRLISQMHESREELTRALSIADNALSVSETGKDELGALQARLARIRLLRKMGKDRAGDIKDLMRQINGRQFVSLLRRRPAVARELAAEIAQIDTRSLRLAMDTIGIEILDDAQVDLLADLLSDWNAEGRAKKPGELAESLGLQRGLLTVDEWRKWINDNNTKQLTQQILSSTYSLEPSDAVRNKFGDLFQHSVETVIAPASQSTRHRS